MSYNTKVYNYYDGAQVRYYANSIKEKTIDEVVTEDNFVSVYSFEESAPIIYESDKDHSLHSAQSRAIQKIYHIARSIKWEWFITLTFNPDKVDSFDYDSCVKAVKNWLDYVRRHTEEFQYIIVPEKHKSGRFHFHGLCNGFAEDHMTDSGLIDCAGRVIYNIDNYNYGFTTATKIGESERAVSYLGKYVTKDVMSSTEGRKRYWASKNIPLADVFTFESEPDQLLKDIASSVTWTKTAGNLFNKTTYYELDEEYN